MLHGWQAGVWARWPWVYTMSDLTKALHWAVSTCMLLSLFFVHLRKKKKKKNLRSKLICPRSCKLFKWLSWDWLTRIHSSDKHSSSSMQGLCPETWRCHALQELADRKQSTWWVWSGKDVSESVPEVAEAGRRENISPEHKQIGTEMWSTVVGKEGKLGAVK